MCTYGTVTYGPWPLCGSCASMAWFGRGSGGLQQLSSLMVQQGSTWTWIDDLVQRSGAELGDGFTCPGSSLTVDRLRERTRGV